MIQRAALYARVSTKDRGQDSENQLRELRFFADSSKYEVVDTFVDEVSGSGKKVRPEFERMFEDARKKKFDVILFWSLDRFSREGVVETLNHLTRLTGYGCGWRSYSEQYLDSTGIFREAVIAILAAIAKQERVRISERVTAGLVTARLKGKRLGRPLAACRPERAKELRDKGLSWREIAKETGVSHMTAKRLCA